MPLNIGWGDIAIRLALTLLAGAVIGLNRGAQRRPVGLRTTMLVCLAASITMILVNLMLPSVDGPEGLLRLPQGLLAGMGFIGAGAIVRRNDLVEGVTTAATLWYVTVMGLCLGAGYIGIGLVALALGAFVLWCLKWAERLIGIPRRASLTVAFDGAGPVEKQIEAMLDRAGYQIAAQSRCLVQSDQSCEIRYELRWYDHGPSRETPPLAVDLARQVGVRRLEWEQAAID